MIPFGPFCEESVMKAMPSLLLLLLPPPPLLPPPLLPPPLLLLLVLLWWPLIAAQLLLTCPFTLLLLRLLLLAAYACTICRSISSLMPMMAAWLLPAIVFASSIVLARNFSRGTR